MGEKNQGSFLLLFLILTTLSPQTHLLSDVGIEEKEKRKRRREARREGEGERERGRALVSHPLPVRTLIHHGGSTLMTSSIPNYVLKAPPPNVITLGVRASAYKFWGDMSIMSITPCLYYRPVFNV